MTNDHSTMLDLSAEIRAESKHQFRTQPIRICADPASDVFDEQGLTLYPHDVDLATKIDVLQEALISDFQAQGERELEGTALDRARAAGATEELDRLEERELDLHSRYAHDRHCYNVAYAQNAIRFLEAAGFRDRRVEIAFKGSFEAVPADELEVAMAAAAKAVTPLPMSGLTPSAHEGNPAVEYLQKCGSAWPFIEPQGIQRSEMVGGLGGEFVASSVGLPIAPMSGQKKHASEANSR